MQGYTCILQMECPDSWNLPCVLFHKLDLPWAFIRLWGIMLCLCFPSSPLIFMPLPLYIRKPHLSPIHNLVLLSQSMKASRVANKGTAGNTEVPLRISAYPQWQCLGQEEIYTQSQFAFQPTGPGCSGERVIKSRNEGIKRRFLELDIIVPGDIFKWMPRFLSLRMTQ